MGYFSPIVIYKNPNENRSNSIIRYIGHRVKSEGKKNFLCFITGQTGAGKSYAAISMAEIYSNMFGIEFYPEYHIITSLKEMLLLINEPKETRKIKFGSVIVFDEPQVEGDASRWQSEINQALTQLVSTFRNQRLVVFFVCPYKEMIVKSSRTLFHGDFRVLGYNLNTKLALVKPRFLEWNDKKQEFYYKRLTVGYKEEGKEVLTYRKLNKWLVPLASQHILDIYERKKEEFTTQLNKKLLNSVILEEKRKFGYNKNEEFLLIEKLFDKYGEDYLAISKEVPHINILSLEKYIYLIKKSKKLTQKRTKRD